jgi:hypothetical protein
VGKANVMSIQDVLANTWVDDTGVLLCEGRRRAAQLDDPHWLPLHDGAGPRHIRSCGRSQVRDAFVTFAFALKVFIIGN